MFGVGFCDFLLYLGVFMIHCFNFLGTCLISFVYLLIEFGVGLKCVICSTFR